MTTETTCTHLLTTATGIAQDIVGDCIAYEGGNRSQVVQEDCLSLVADYTKDVVDTKHTTQLTDLVVDQLKALVPSVGSTGSMKQVVISALKKGHTFKRKPDAAASYIRNHYNRKDAFGPANYSASDSDDMNREIFLKPSTKVWISA